MHHATLHSIPIKVSHSRSESSCSRSSCSSSPVSTNPSSVASQADEEEHLEHLSNKTFDALRSLIREKRDSQCVISAWRVRCETLEAEVARLARIVETLEGEKREWKQQQQSFTKASSVASSSDANEKDTVVRVCTDWRAAVSKSQPIPVVDPSKSMSKQNPPPCNSYYLCGSCSVPRCKFSHLYQLTVPQIEEMRRGAKFHICNSVKNGAECTDPACCYGHVCPRGTACGRTNCAFNDEQHKGSSTVRLAPKSPVRS
ncbi:hypothetical protein T439DRAFT_351529 [Meredithblackwellia eburnea MCA 4105]